VHDARPGHFAAAARHAIRATRLRARHFLSIDPNPHRMEAAMNAAPACPQCAMENTYPDGTLTVCADCGHEWSAGAGAEAGDEPAGDVVKDANGNVLSDGDSVVLIKDLRVKGSSITLKMGTKVKSIRLVGGDHEVDCKTDMGGFMLKACYLKKV
jgi:protein PhnA